VSQTLYRRKAILTRIRQALDALYLLQEIDWEFDVRTFLENILAQALKEIEFEGGKQIERALIVVQRSEGRELEIQAGWKTGDLDLSFSRTVVRRTMSSGQGILCENAKDDPRFMEAESIKGLEMLSLISVPLSIGGRSVGALYIESKSPGRLFNEEDLAFLKEFTDAIAPHLKAALTHRDHLEAIKDLQAEITSRRRFSTIIGRSESMRNVFDLVRIASQVDRTVLLTGESGCGKELIANAIHDNGPRKESSFVVVDCSSLSEHLLESELFGHRKGAFTGASTDKIGAFEEADGGTIFLDEISDASKPLQQKLRRVLQEGEIRRVGENLVRKVNVRVICATNRNLAELVDKGDFIRDLYFRVNKFPINIPPLRERREDIPLLVHHFLELAAKDSVEPSKRMHPDALELLVSRDWAANNVRELMNTVELAVDFTRSAEISSDTIERVFRVQRGETQHGPEAAGTTPAPRHGHGSLVQVRTEDFRSLLEEMRGEDGDGPDTKGDTPFYRIQLEVAARAIIEGLRASDWKLRPAAKLLGISPTKLRCDLKEFFQRVLQRTEGDVEEAAAIAYIPAAVLRRKMADLGLAASGREE
jgi:transcriptional regulator with GAF, ATPase, and Fis domain